MTILRRLDITTWYLKYVNTQYPSQPSYLWLHASSTEPGQLHENAGRWPELAKAELQASFGFVACEVYTPEIKQARDARVLARKKQRSFGDGWIQLQDAKHFIQVRGKK